MRPTDILGLASLLLTAGVAANPVYRRSPSDPYGGYYPDPNNPNGGYSSNPYGGSPTNPSKPYAAAPNPYNPYAASPPNPGNPYGGSHPNPANVPLPPAHEQGYQPASGYSGLHRDSVGDTNVYYGSKPVEQGGIPKHAAHVEYNYNKHPSNNQPLPVNEDTRKDKDKLRSDMISKKPPKTGKHRDHKPANVQKLPGSNEDRKAVNTVQHLPPKESHKEAVLLGKAKGYANHPDASGQIKVNPNRASSDSDPSTEESVHSRGKDGRPSTGPRPSPPLPPLPPDPSQKSSKKGSSSRGSRSKENSSKGSSSKDKKGKEKGKRDLDALIRGLLTKRALEMEYYF